MLLLLLVPLLAWSGEPTPKVKLETSLGTIVVELYPDKAPQTVANFLQYVRSGFYNGTVFHRVVPDFVVQGGGFDTQLRKKPTNPPIPNEAGNGLSNRRGTVAMARTAEVDSATSQFFINLKDNTFLDHRDRTPRGFGYCVFGRVVEGMEVVDAIAALPTGPAGPFPAEVPQKPAVILKAEVLASSPTP
ncbi:MAG: peptidylprolyl isomerase [Thermoanaerobaculum sp.]|nr:peptidylprolyl isomerase [Thermoanaerobaculum sp.]